MTDRISLTFTQLELLDFVAAHGSMTAAAEAAHTTQSNVSSAIARVEHALGVELVVRHRSKGVSLTPAGEEVVARSRSILDATRHLQDWARADGGELAGDLCLGTFHSLTPFYVPTLARALRETAPELRLEMREAPLDVLPRLVQNADLDLALVYDQGVPASLDFATMAVVAPYVIVSADSPLARWRRVRLSDLSGLTMVNYDVPFAIDRARDLFAEVGLASPSEIVAATTETLRALVGAGLGFAVLHQHWSTDVTADGARVVSLAIADDVTPLRLGTITRPKHTSAKVRLAQRLLRDVAQERHGQFGPLPRN